MPRRPRLKDIIADKLLEVKAAGSAVERLAVKAEAVLDAIIEAGEVVIRPRQRADSSGGVVDRSFVFQRMLERIEFVIALPDDEPEGE